MAKKIPQRMCVVTKERHEKRDLLRVVRNKNNEVFVDVTGKQNGRGVYLSASEEIIAKAKQSKILERVLEVEVPDNIYEELINLIKVR